MVYLESTTSSLFLEKPVEIEAYQSILAALAETALGEGGAENGNCVEVAPTPDAVRR